MHKGNPHKHENSKDSVVKMDIYVILDKGEKLVGSDGIAKEVGNLQVVEEDQSIMVGRVLLQGNMVS